MFIGRCGGSGPGGREYGGWGGGWSADCDPGGYGGRDPGGYGECDPGG